MLDLSNENVIHIKNKDIEYLQFKKLLQYPELVHCYTLSANNFDIASNDTMETKKEIVLNNYKELSQVLNIEYNHIIRPYQTHTDIVKRVDDIPNSIQIFPKKYWEVDGLITTKKNISLSLSYADCIPLLFYEPVKKVIGNIHSGWKGTLNKIAKKAVLKMIEEYGCNPKNIICVICPSIRKCHFEVQKDVYEMFYKEFLYTGRIDDIISQEDNNNSKYYIDTVLINKIILKEAGLQEENIIDSKICTACNSKLMHSYRMNDKAGRNTAIIALK